MIELYAHPFSSYSWKALIAFHEADVPFINRNIDPEHPENFSKLQMISPLGKFPAIVDDARSLFEASIITEYLHQRHSRAAPLIPGDPGAAIEVRMLDRFFDNYVMTPMQRIVADFIRPPAERDPRTIAESNAMLRRSYIWLEARLSGRKFIGGETFTLADCAAAPSLFYADWVCEVGPELSNLKSYRARLLARPSVKRCVDDARPYRSYFPPGAPDRD